MDGSDIDLVMKAKVSGDGGAFAELVRRHQSRLRAFLMRLCGDAALTDDLAQESLLKAHRGLAAFKGGSSFRSWLFSIAYREFLQTKRRERAAIKLEKELIEHAPPNQAVHESRMTLDVQHALASLDDMERACLLLCDAAGFSHAEASSALQAPLGSVKTYIARGRTKMRDFMTNEAASSGNATNTHSMTGAAHVR